MRKIVVNAMGEQCPIPVVKAKKAMAELPQEGGEAETDQANKSAGWMPGH